MSERKRRGRVVGRRPLVIHIYRGYGTDRVLQVRGRVGRAPGLIHQVEQWKALGRLATFYRRLASRGFGDAVVEARYGGVRQRAVTDRNGYFELSLDLGEVLAPEQRPLPKVRLELIEPGTRIEEGSERWAEVLVPSRRARFGVISDIDDTVVLTGVANWAVMLYRTMVSEAGGRVAFPGVAAFYRALAEGAGAEGNPLFYVSRSPWSLYPVLEEFFEDNRLPDGPVLFLRDWGVTPRHPLPQRAPAHKEDIIREILETYPSLPFILIGDSGQHDPEVYLEVVARHPGRVMAIYIRNVSRGSKRPEAIRALSREAARAGVAFVLTRDTRSWAEHAADQGWIRPEALESVEREKRRESRRRLDGLRRAGLTWLGLPEP